MDINKDIEDVEINISQKDRDLLQKLRTKNIPKSKNSDSLNIGDVFFLNGIYYTISEDNEPYMAYIVTPFVELISDEDLIITINNKLFGLLSLVRYVSNETIDNSIKIANIKNDVNIMNKYINEGEDLPKNRVGLSYPEGENYYQELFRKEEARRSLFLAAGVFEFEEYKETDKVIVLQEVIKSKIINRAKMKMAASSEDKIRVVDFGYLSLESGGLCIYFDDSYIGKECEIEYDKDIIFDGTIPNRLLITGITEQKALDELKDGLVLYIKE